MWPYRLIAPGSIFVDDIWSTYTTRLFTKCRHLDPNDSAREAAFFGAKLPLW